MVLSGETAAAFAGMSLLWTNVMICARVTPAASRRFWTSWGIMILGFCSCSSTSSGSICECKRMQISAQGMHV